jgi:16S rRNA processing protein RimM
MSILKKDCVYVGFISKAHGNKGEMQLVLQTKLPDDFPSPKWAFMEIGQKPVPFLLTKFECIANEKVILAFDEIDSMAKAERLCSHRLFLTTNELPALESEDQFRNYEIIGFTVKDEKTGVVGIIEAIEENTHQPLLIVINKNKDEILIPLVADFIKKINKKRKELIMDLPEGLIN